MHWNGEVDENHPRSPYSGRYEEWRFRMNCVKDLSNFRNSGFKFEFHEPQTAMKEPIADASPANQVVLNGHGMRRLLVFVSNRVKEVDREECKFDGVQGPPPRNNGVFFTDPYFEQLIDNTDDTSVTGLEPLPHFIEEGFVKIAIGGHRAITNEDPWVGLNSYDVDMKRGFSNMEFAIKVMEI